MIAGLNKEDWLCYDRRVVVHVSRMRARDLMRELAAVLHFTWDRSGDEGKWVYRLSQTKEQWEEEDSLRKSHIEAGSATSRQTGSRTGTTANGPWFCQQGSSEIQQPVDVYPGNQPLGQAVVDFLDGHPAAHEAYASGVECNSIPVVSLSAALQASVKKIAESYAEMTKGLGSADDVVGSLKDFDQFQVTVNRRMPTGAAYEVSRESTGCPARFQLGIQWAG